jgi:hypothetical protein
VWVHTLIVVSSRQRQSELIHVRRRRSTCYIRSTKCADCCSEC